MCDAAVCIAERRVTVVQQSPALASHVVSTCRRHVADGCQAAGHRRWQWRASWATAPHYAAYAAHRWSVQWHLFSMAILQSHQLVAAAGGSAFRWWWSGQTDPPGIPDAVVTW